MKQEHIQAYNLLIEFSKIQKMPDTLERALAIQQWGGKATAFVKSNPSCFPELILVQAEHRQPLQNCDDVNQQA